MALSRPIPIEKINLGGISDSIYAGAKHAVAKLVGWDLHSKPGLLTVRQKMTKDSASVIDEFCKVGLVVSNGDIYWFVCEFPYLVVSYPRSTYVQLNLVFSYQDLLYVLS